MGFDDYYQQHTHTAQKQQGLIHTDTKNFCFGWMDESRAPLFLFFFFVPSSSGDMMNPSLCETGLSFIHHLSVITTHLYYRSSLLSSLREE
jgi:hypothetical protein